MAHSGYIMQSEHANRAEITDTPWAPVGMVFICGIEYVPYFAAWSLSQSAIWPCGYVLERKLYIKDQ
jgi:hypothetical protein